MNIDYKTKLISDPGYKSKILRFVVDMLNQVIPLQDSLEFVNNNNMSDFFNQSPPFYLIENAKYEKMISAFNHFFQTIHMNRLMLYSANYIAKREAIPLNTGDVNLDKIKKIMGTKIYKHICDLAYDRGEPIITDSEYDALFGDDASGMVMPAAFGGAAGRVISLPAWMGSLDKIKTEKTFVEWLNKIKKLKIQHVVITPKLDGISALLSSKEMYTRGDGTTGSSLTHIIPYIHKEYNDPLGLNPDDYIRGELVMKKNIFNTYYAKDFKNARNLIAGQVSRKSIDKDVLQHINFVPYEWIDKKFVNISPTEQLSYLYGPPEILNTSGFIWLKLETSALSFRLLNEILDDWNLKIPYDIDGLVVAPGITYTSIKSGNPELTIAFKKSADTEDESVIATVVKVVWDISKWGIYIPVIYIEPTSLGGVIVSKVAGHNAKNIIDKKIGVGAVVKVVRSGKVIPHIVQVITPSDNIVLPEGIWDGVNLRVNKSIQQNKQAETISRIKTLTDLLLKLGVKNISLKTVEKLYIVCKLTDFFKLINCTALDLSPSFPVNSKTNAMILDEFRKLKCRPLPLHLLVAASGVLGESIGREKTKLLLASVGYSKVPTVAELVRIPGFAEKTAQHIIDHFGEMQQFIQQCKDNNLNIIIENDTPQLPQVPRPSLLGAQINRGGVVPSSGAPTGALPLLVAPAKPIICLSGFRDESLKQFFTVKDSVTQDVQFLVVKSKIEETTKTLKAKKLRIPILTLPELLQTFKPQ